MSPVFCGALYFGKCLLFVSYKYTCGAALLELKPGIVIKKYLHLRVFSMLNEQHIPESVGDVSKISAQSTTF